MLCYHNHAESKHLPAIQPILQRVSVQSPALSCLLAGDHPDLEPASEKWWYSETDKETSSASFLSHQESEKQNAASLPKVFVPLLREPGCSQWPPCTLGSTAQPPAVLRPSWEVSCPRCATAHPHFGKCWWGSNIDGITGWNYLQQLRKAKTQTC